MIGAAVNGLPAGTYEAALEGAKQGALIGLPFAGFVLLVHTLRSKEGVKKQIKENRCTSIYMHDKPAMGLVFGAVSSAMYLLSAIAVDVVAGTNLSYAAAAKVGGIDGLYSTVKNAYQGKKLKEKFNQEIALKENRFNPFTGSYRSTV